MGPLSGPSSEQDFAFISELMEMIEYAPNNTQPRWILVQIYETYGWLDEAANLAQQILAISPEDNDAQAFKQWLIAYKRRELSRRVPEASPGRDLARDEDKVEAVWDGTQLSGGLKELETGYRDLIEHAKDLLEELHVYQEMCPELDMTGQIADIKAMTEGRFSSVVKIKPPLSVESIASSVKSTKGSAVEVVFADLEAHARWLRAQKNTGQDQLRDDIQKRGQAIKAALPARLKADVDVAFMHVEHELLNRTYQNNDTHTMIGELISAVPRSNFWVSEDGYAWDMEELADAIKSNKGVMRNPLSGNMFTADDVKSIVRHPLGKRLAAIEKQQKQLTQGVRQDTVDRLGKLANVLLVDEDAATASRIAVDEFLAYSATLPEAEQNALVNLRVPAKDSHTGQSFDMSIGQAVADAKANKLCFHKAGDLLQQATVFLRSKRR